jgi:hypothetical protein
MRKVRAALAGLTLGVLMSVTSPAVVALAAPAPVPAAIGLVAQQTTAPPGPRIDPSDNARANAEKTKSKIVVGVLAVVLAAIVLWGRSIRRKRRKKSSDQAKGK